MKLGGLIWKGFHLSLLFVLLVGPNIVSSQCQKINSCSCRLPTGVIDLSPLGSGNPLYKDLKATQFPDDFLYSWNPCKPFTGEGSCTDVAVCQKSTDGQTTYSLGSQDSAAFAGDNTTVTLGYTGPAPDNRQSVIALTCTSGATQFTVLGEDTSASVYKFELKSPCACPGSSGSCGSSGISGGWIFVIILVVVLVVYLVGGVLFMSLVKKASGAERIPNVEFWKDLPVLVKDGAVLVISPCRKEGKYDSI
ncbi:cation-dependent mannose-6-phosphate receptor-like [Branchiostoma lanceolatum]|uniref:cation-dependent mannose-6-phosphate receptor-like n=1 Tax=Branchiostoma lanceolatum TaxID=7740 RepID=UPI003454F82D